MAKKQAKTRLPGKTLGGKAPQEKGAGKRGKKGGKGAKVEIPVRSLLAVATALEHPRLLKGNEWDMNRLQRSVAHFEDGIAIGTNGQLMTLARCQCGNGPLSLPVPHPSTREGKALYRSKEGTAVHEGGKWTFPDGEWDPPGDLFSRVDRMQALPWRFPFPKDADRKKPAEAGKTVCMADAVLEKILGTMKALDAVLWKAMFAEGQNRLCSLAYIGSDNEMIKEVVSLSHLSDSKKMHADSKGMLVPKWVKDAVYDEKGEKKGVQPREKIDRYDDGRDAEQSP